MKITTEQYQEIKHILPVQRGNVSIDNLTFINALLYICENDCKWRRLKKEYGKWYVIYKRFHRRVHMGTIRTLFEQLHVLGSVEQNEVVRFLDSMSAPVHPDACGALKKKENKP